MLLQIWMLFSASRLINSIVEEKQQKTRIMVDEHNRKYKVSPAEIPRFIAWAIGEENLVGCNNIPQRAEYFDALFEILVPLWNKRHGNTLTLYAKNGGQHNYSQMLNLWINLGKP